MWVYFDVQFCCILQSCLSFLPHWAVTGVCSIENKQPRFFRLTPIVSFAEANTHLGGDVLIFTVISFWSHYLFNVVSNARIWISWQFQHLYMKRYRWNFCFRQLGCSVLNVLEIDNIFKFLLLSMAFLVTILKCFIFKKKSLYFFALS